VLLGGLLVPVPRPRRAGVPVIARFVLHLEAHRGYWPRVSFRRAPRPGDRVVDGGEPGILVACRECSGQGLLHAPDDGVSRRPSSATALAAVREMVRRLEGAQGGGLTYGYALARIRSVLDAGRLT
jgi:hypothetical protein